MKTVDLYDKNHLIIDNLLRVIHLLLLANGEFFPLATYKDVKGEISSFNNIDYSDLPQVEKNLKRYQTILEEKIKNQEIHSCGIAYDILTTNYHTKEKTSAIAINVLNIKPNFSGTIYYSYNLPKGKSFEITGIWQEKIR